MGRRVRVSVAVAIVAVCAYYYTKKDPISDLDVSGFWEPQFKEVANVFRENLKNGFTRGASFAAYKDGKLVVDLWGGYTDEQNKLLWREDTITHVASVTKFVATVAFSTLIEKGFVRYDDLVVKYWPEFGQHGKDNVTVNMLLSHRAGLYYLDTMLSFREIIDNPEKVDAVLAAQKPHWPPGTAIGYHGLTIGMYVDYLARRVDPKHRSIYQIYEEDVKRPFEIDFFMGTPKAIQYRLARIHLHTFKDSVYSFVHMPSFRRFLLHLITGKSKIEEMFNNNPKEEMQGLFSDPYVREIPIASVSGTGTAMALAKMAGLLAARTSYNGKQLLSDDIVSSLNTPSFSGMEKLMGFNSTVGHGTFIFQNPKGDNVFGHPGAGGQMCYSDPKYKVGLAFITNYLSAFSLNDDLRFVPLEKAFYKCLERSA